MRMLLCNILFCPKKEKKVYQIYFFAQKNRKKYISILLSLGQRPGPGILGTLFAITLVWTPQGEHNTND